MATTINNNTTTNVDELIKETNTIKPTESFTTCDRTSAVKLRIGKDGNQAIEPLSVPGLLNQTALEYPDTAALKFKDSQNNWQTVTYSEYKTKVHQIAKMFIKLGLEPHNSVGILAFNSPEWFYSELGSIHAGGIASGIYTTNSPDAVYHVLNSSHANIVVVDDAKQMEKIRQIRNRLPLLKAAIQIQGPFEDYIKSEDGYYRWSELETKNYDDCQEEFESRLKSIRVNECCCLVYTSGTVGNPKGVMINHDSMTWMSYSVGLRLPNVKYGTETLISFLPLSHIAAQMVDIFLPIRFGACVYFADKDALKGTLINTLLDARPTRFLGVPRVYEKIYEKMMSIAAQNNGIKRMIAAWAKGHTLQHWLDVIDNKESETVQYKTARYLIMSKVKEGLGLNRCETLATAAAPLSPDIKRYFLSLDLPIVEAFGMSETSGAHSVGTPFAFNLDTLGKPLDGVDTNIINKDEQGHGEILMRGRHIFMGYINEIEKTAEAIDDDGWLHSGDLGYLDDNGFLYITGRLKELIITAGGENIPPVHIEHLVKKELDCLSYAFLVGDQRKFLTMLVTLKTHVDLDTGMPKDELHPETKTWVKSLGESYTNLSEILAAGPCPKIMKGITEAITRANKYSTSNAQKVQKFALLPHDFSVPTGELGPTLKVKRNVVTEKYKNEIEKLYEE